MATQLLPSSVHQPAECSFFPFLVTNVLQKVFYIASHGAAINFLIEHLLFLSSDFFSYQLNFSLI